MYKLLGILLVVSTIAVSWWTVNFSLFHVVLMHLGCAIVFVWLVAMPAVGDKE